MKPRATRDSKGHGSADIESSLKPVSGTLEATRGTATQVLTSILVALEPVGQLGISEDAS